MNEAGPRRQKIKEFLEKIEAAALPLLLRSRLEETLESLNQSFNFLDWEVNRKYLNWILSLPWDKETADNLDLKRAQKILTANHFGMAKIKDRILEYIAVLKMTQGQKATLGRGSVLCFTGLPGLGKTSMGVSVAQSLGRQLIRLPFGGLGEVSQIRGLPRYLPSSEPGQIIKGLRHAESKNPVILLDEIDRVDETARGVIMGALLELLDPEQNAEFNDYYLDFPFDLSRALFICTANNTRGIANAVLDRLEIMEMPSYSDEEKKIIGRDYLLPKVLAACGLQAEQLIIDESLWIKIIRPLGFDAGIRTLERTIEALGRKAARLIVEGQGDRFVLDEANLKDFLP